MFAVIKKIIYLFCLIIILPDSPTGTEAAGRIGMSYLWLDEEGNQSLSHNTYNVYDGWGLSLEDIRLVFGNNIRLTADLKNITLDNRHLDLTLRQPGQFNIRLFNRQYRRIYDAGNNVFTRRKQSGIALTAIPRKYLTFFGDGTYTSKSGLTTSLGETSEFAPPHAIDYDQISFKTGVNLAAHGRMIQVEYHYTDYEEENYLSDNQTRHFNRVRGILPIPGREWIVLSGRYEYFKTKYDNTRRFLRVNSGHVGMSLKFPDHLTFSYAFYIDDIHSGINSKNIDNIAHNISLGYIRPGILAATGGLRYDLRDEEDAASKGLTYYLSARYTPRRAFEFRLKYGGRRQDLDRGLRLLGERTRDRFQIRGVFRKDRWGSLTAGFEKRHRTNDLIGSESNYDRSSIDLEVFLTDHGAMTGGYAFSVGDYDNVENNFEFHNHVIHADLAWRDIENLSLSAGLWYIRGKRDIDLDRLTMRFSGSYRIWREYTIEIKYNVYNIDDYLTIDAYHTANLIRLELTREFSL